MEAYWKNIIETLRDGLIIVDPAGTIVAMNGAAERITGYTHDELIGKSCLILNCTGCDVYKEGTGKDWCSLFRSSEVRDKRCLISNKKHEAVHVLKNATVLRDENREIMGAVEVLTDISDEVRKERDLLRLKNICTMNGDFFGIIGTSAPMQRLKELVINVAKTRTPVLIQGQSGTGKELVARAIHLSSTRKDGPYIQVNCSALNENLLESELFGHVKGAFTGADQARMGRFEAANGGTIFLDEIGDISFSIQTKLLRVLEEGKIERVGDHRPIFVDVRIITATNRDLDAMVAEGRFREDLFFRINVFPIECPPITERKEDIPVIIQEFIRRNNIEFRKNIRGLSKEALELIMEFDWPGNIREIRNAIEYAFVLCPGDIIDTGHLPTRISKQGRLKRKRSEDTDPETERRRIMEALKESGGNRTRAARTLNISRVTLYKRMKKYSIPI